MSGKIELVSLEKVQGAQQEEGLFQIRELINQSQGPRRIEFEHAVVSALRPGRAGDPIPRTTEVILSFDDEFDDFSRKLQHLSKE